MLLLSSRGDHSLRPALEAIAAYPVMAAEAACLGEHPPTNVVVLGEVVAEALPVEQTVVSMVHLSELTRVFVEQLPTTLHTCGRECLPRICLGRKFLRRGDVAVHPCAKRQAPCLCHSLLCSQIHHLGLFVVQAFLTLL